MNKYTIIQNTWMGDDDVDLLNYVKFNNIPTKFLSVEEILELNISEIDVLFADTCVVQKLINPICVPECYPEVFDKLYHRKIQTICAKDAFNIKTKCFIKPYDNNKSFNAHIIKSAIDIEFFKRDLEDNNIDENSKVYISSLVNFVNEFRLFIGDGKIYGMVESTKLLIDPNKAKSIEPPAEFIEQILQILQMKHYKYCVIDIGFIENSSISAWAIVEVNPAFALTSYDWDIEKYYEYCRDAWQYYKSK
jgi:hypothetical protein